jgi:hypothetical protein
MGGETERAATPLPLALRCSCGYPSLSHRLWMNREVQAVFSARPRFTEYNSA